MSLLLAPYSNAMRLGQGFNSYTQQICVDDAVVVDPKRAENVLTNDGTTMRILAENSGKPSAWNRLPEVIDESPVTAKALDAKPAAAATTAVAPVADSSATPASDIATKVTDASADVPVGDKADSSSKETRTPKETKTAKETQAAKESETADLVTANADAADTKEREPATDSVDDTTSAGELDGEASDKVVETAEKERSDKVQKDKKAVKKGVVVDADEAGETETSKTPVSDKAPGAKDAPVPPTPTEKSGDLKMKNRSPSVGHEQDKLQRGEVKTRPAQSKVKEFSPRAPEDATLTPHAPKPAAHKALSDIEAEQARLDKAEKLHMMQLEKDRMAEHRAYQRTLELAARKEEQDRLEEDRKEQREIRAEKRQYEAARRAAAQQAIKEAVAAKKDPLTLEELNKIKAQNQFADRFEGLENSDQSYPFDASGERGPSQTVTYTSRFIDKLSDVTEDMAISGALSVKMAKIGGSGRGSFVDSDKFKQSDLNFYISVKVTNQTVNFKDALVYNRMRSVEIGSDDFNKVYGDSFISGFQEGGEFNAVISMKVHNRAKLLDIKAEAKVALTAGPVDITAEANVGIAKTNLEMNTETTIQVSWCGGGHIKPMEQPWNIQSVMQAAARFPSLVAACPQRTYAILTKYDNLRSFVSLRPAKYSPIQYENAQVYTNVLMDAFMSYKSLYKKLGDQVYSIQNKTLEIEPWPSTDGETIDEESTSQASTKANSQALTAIGQAAASGNEVALSAAKKYAAALTAADDTKPFLASLRGLSDARKFCRRQMVYIVNEVDLIEKDPKVATDQDHEEPFQSPLLFETRLPSMKIPEALKPKSDPITGKRIMARTQTEEELEREQTEQDKLENESPSLYQLDQDLSVDETTSLDATRRKFPMVGKHLQVSKAAPKTDKGVPFNNLEFLDPDWQVESITIGITKRGCVGSVGVIYENGLSLRKGLPSESLVQKTLTNFQPGERITSAAIEVGALATDPKIASDENVRVLSICMYSNRGRRLLGQAVKNEVLPGGRVRKDDVEYEQVKTLYLDSAYNTGTFKGFFGRVSMDETAGGILRLGLIWGDSTSMKLSTTVTDAAPVYDTDFSASNATIEAYKEERDKARQETLDLHDKTVQRVDEVGKEFQIKIAEAREQAKQIKFANGVHTTRQSVSFKGDTFRVSPSNTPFLRFENGNDFIYQLDGNLTVYTADRTVVWSMNRYADGAGELIFHGGNDGNLVAWRTGGSTWSTETRDCKNGFLVFSSERPFMEIFTENGVRRCSYP